MSKNEDVPIIWRKGGFLTVPEKEEFEYERKARIQTGIDDRLVAIYARKSRITNKGDSIGVQLSKAPIMRSTSFPYRKITNLLDMRTKA